jgi:NYN domain
MSERSAIFIDAGYLLAAGGRLCCGTTSRGGFVCDYKLLTADLAVWVREHSGGMESLRTYWYDGAAKAVATPEHEAIGVLPYVKVRLGRIHSGQQKGVDALIYRDLMTLARERAVSRAYLLSGDEDLREGVVAAQDMGVQVILIGIPTSQRTNQSAALIREADEHVVLSREYWTKYFIARPDPSPKESPAPTPMAALSAGRAFAIQWACDAEPGDVEQLLSAAPRIPRPLDVSLLTEAEKALGSLRENQDLRQELRAGFWAGIRREDEPPSSP